MKEGLFVKRIGSIIVDAVFVISCLNFNAFAYHYNR